MTTVEDPPPSPPSLPPLPACESYSSLTTYEACPRRYAFRYVERLPGEVRPGQFAFGNAVHKAFEVFVRERIRANAHDVGVSDRAGAAVAAPDAAGVRSPFAPGPVPGPVPEPVAEPGLETLRRTCDRVLESAGLEPAELDEARARAEPVLVRFVEREAANPSTPVAVELGFGIDVTIQREAARIRFVGYVDRLDRAPDGSTQVLDYKTGRAKSQADVDADRQLTAYAYACARGALRDPATGRPLPPASRLALYFAESGTEVATARTADQLTAFEGDLASMVTAVRRRVFDARPGSWRCRWCEYRGTCPDAAAPG
jgi:RecB family exonuclease